MDKILYNAKIYSPNNQESFYEAVGIKDNLIVKVGNNQEVLSLRNTSTILIDCEENLVIPGFNDSHMHLLSTGRLLSWVNLSNAKSISDVINITKEFILNNEQHDVIVGHGWNHDYFRDDKRFITASDLDQVSTTKPILLYRACGHIMSVNSQAIKKANIDLNHQV
ncbi:MAG: amidohydrolase family protein, partial [Bacilli bacterium]